MMLFALTFLRSLESKVNNKFYAALHAESGGLALTISMPVDREFLGFTTVFSEDGLEDRDLLSAQLDRIAAHCNFMVRDFYKKRYTREA